MEVAVRKALKSLDLNDRDEDIRKPSRGCEVSVEGYDVSLKKFGLRLVLKKQLASCGEISCISVMSNKKKGILKSVAFVRIKGEDAEKKALERSGTDFGGWTAIIKAAQSPEVYSDPYDPRIKPFRMVVSGFDTSLADIDIEIALYQAFSSCGEVMDVGVFPTSRHQALVVIFGVRCEDNAMSLNGRNVGGMDLVVKPLNGPLDKNKRRRAARHTTGYMLPSRILELGKLKENAKKKMEMDKEKATKKMKMDKEEMVKMKKALFL